MNDERREHGAVNESFLEQQIRESNDHTLIVKKNWSPSTSGIGSYVSQVSRLARPSDEIIILEIFKIQ